MISRAVGGAKRGTPSTGTATTTASAMGCPSRSLTTAVISAADAGPAAAATPAATNPNASSAAVRRALPLSSIGVYEELIELSAPVIDSALGVGDLPGEANVQRRVWRLGEARAAEAPVAPHVAEHWPH